VKVFFTVSLSLEGEGQGEVKRVRGSFPLTSILSRGGERKITVRDLSRGKEGDLIRAAVRDRGRSAPVPGPHFA
jgi:hypothetical protein